MTIPFDFQPHTTRYSPQNAYWLGRAAQLAYSKMSDDNFISDRIEILREMQSWSDGFQDVAVFDKNSSQGFVAKHRDFIIVAFRGSDNWRDWLDNLNLPAISHNLGRVHRGFQMALEDIWFDMLETITEFKDNYQSLWITGHSLGGALATLAAAERIAEDRPFNGVYTFGQPRCVDRPMARNMNVEAKGRIFRFQNNNDIVTRIPQRIMSYSHLGTFIYIDVNKTFRTDIHWWNQFLDRVSGILRALNEIGIDKIEDHKMERYLEALELNIDRVPQEL